MRTRSRSVPRGRHGCRLVVARPRPALLAPESSDACPPTKIGPSIRRGVELMQAEWTVEVGGWGRGLGQWWRCLAPLVLAAVVLAAGWLASGGRQTAPAGTAAAA